MAKKIATRAETNVWLVGQLLTNISEVNATQLPTAGIVLRRLYHSIRIRKLNLSQSCNEVSVEVMEFWILANIATTQLPNVVSRLKALYKNTFHSAETNFGATRDSNSLKVHLLLL